MNETKRLDLSLFYDDLYSQLTLKIGSIIFVVGKSPMDIMESILCRKSSIEKIICNHYFLS